MKKSHFVLSSLALLFATVLLSCAQTPQTETTSTETNPAATTESVTSESAPANDTPGEAGIMQFRANGEDFVRQGFVSKDGWQIDFENVYIHITDAKAYETFTPYDPQAGGEPQPKQEISLVTEKTIDLAAGDQTAETILVNEVPAPPGRYNAISWKMTKAADGPANGAAIMMQGTATKDGQTIPFTIKIDEELGFTCGEYVGDERKGILEPGGKSDLEATFHFDHLFGDGGAAPEDEINTGALGFEPIAATAQAGRVDADLETLKSQLSPEDYDKFIKILPSLGHVGEGHCKESRE
ncbi:MAG: DUF4382 domain-containing protein [Oscillatoriales cyanobacterium RM2_1_1]|nr:DUF4382 domain-containing protein [Oscillatoriales cyanobacterium RM2_1_1]